MLKRLWWLSCIFLLSSKHSLQRWLSIVQQFVVSNMWLQSYAHVIHIRVEDSPQNVFRIDLFSLEVGLRKIPVTFHSEIREFNFRKWTRKQEKKSSTEFHSNCSYHIHHRNDPQFGFSHLPDQLHSFRIIFNFSCVQVFSLPYFFKKRWLHIGEKNAMHEFEFNMYDTSKFWMIVLKNLTSIVAFIANMCWSLSPLDAIDDRFEDFFECHNLFRTSMLT